MQVLQPPLWGLHLSLSTLCHPLVWLAPPPRYLLFSSSVSGILCQRAPSWLQALLCFVISVVGSSWWRAKHVEMISVDKDSASVAAGSFSAFPSVVLDTGAHVPWLPFWWTSRVIRSSLSSFCGAALRPAVPFLPAIPGFSPSSLCPSGLSF